MPELSIIISLAMMKILPGVSIERTINVANDIVEVVYQEFDNNSIKNIKTEEEAISLLSGAVVGESGLRKDIERCLISGDRGRSIGLGQLMRGPNWGGYTRSQICNDRKLQLRLSLRALDKCAAGGSTDSSMIFRCYTSGDRRKDSSIARYENNINKSVKLSIVSNTYRQSYGQYLYTKLTRKYHL